MHKCFCHGAICLLTLMFLVWTVSLFVAFMCSTLSLLLFYACACVAYMHFLCKLEKYTSVIVLVSLGMILSFLHLVGFFFLGWTCWQNSWCCWCHCWQWRKNHGGKPLCKMIWVEVGGTYFYDLVQKKGKLVNLFSQFDLLFSSPT